MSEKQKIIAIVGPTASGKTSLSIEIAKKFGGEIISCDSMQIYKGMNIGTAKVTVEEMQGITHHLIDFLDVDVPFSVSDYVELAEKVIEDIVSRGKIPVIAGGTGLYLRSLLYGVNFTENSNDDKIRMALEQDVENGKIDELYQKLEELDFEASQKIHKNNHKRVIRALEYCMSTGKKISEQSVIKEAKYDFLLMGLNFEDREKLYNRINRRVDIMIEQGLLEEARIYTDEKMKTSAQAIGYKELFPYIKNEISFEEAIENIKRETRRYAKRQLTWFKAEKGINWLYVDCENVLDKAEEYVKEFLL